jgi:AraC family transcriptional regulator
MMTRLSPKTYFGRTLRRRDVGGFTLTESAYAPETAIPRHTHENAYLCAVLHGGYTECYGSREQAYRASDLVLHPRGQAHSDQFHREGGRCLNIELSQARWARLEGHPLVEGGGSDLSGGSVRWLVNRLYQEFAALDAPSVLALEGLILVLLAETARGPRSSGERSDPAWLATVRDLLHQHFARPLTLEEIARSAGVHPTHLARVFHRSFHCTIGQYVRRLRVEHACRELASSELALSEIALECGFYDHSQLTRTFRAHTGMTPSEYRRICRR